MLLRPFVKIVLCACMCILEQFCYVHKILHHKEVLICKRPIILNYVLKHTTLTICQFFIMCMLMHITAVFFYVQAFTQAVFLYTKNSII